MDTFNSIAHTLKLIGHPLRLQIVAGLIRQPKCVKDIWECLDMPQAVISQHLAKLKAGGIIEGKRFGVEIHYTVIDPMVKMVVEHLTDNEANL
ncbi:MAG: metalloregulator ArsR/SmtB family transcription factor [Oryzomonas sp.]|uniref:ArsR/SmtB family transcription factor n=1 Tax=Oryzomonas sp. TaxID=2855186 RepID=UPI0028511BD0|nr:metalloregulator ArsR/SmtB family transcription factor [Oryzomonas sp.]MDR3580843.1 metalloregulator ArsR/SmtB family transcription factor [Oryzomonas sp.]